MSGPFRALDALPDLLHQAKAEAGVSESPYARQDALLEQARTRRHCYRWTMPFRHRYRCSTGEHEAGEALLRFGAPGTTGTFHEAELHASTLHEITVHSKPPDATLAAVLGAIHQA